VGRPNVTRADVAAAAGVSRATVSYVLNGVDARVSEETRKRVLEAARTLGYTPHAMASALRAGRTSVVLLALPAWPLGQVLADRVTACVTELERLGYTPLVHFRHGAGPEALVRACDRIRPVGLIAPSTDLDPRRVELLQANGTRAVIALSATPLDHVPAYTFEQPMVGRVAVEHLAERGHTHILALLPDEPELIVLGKHRLAGALEAAAERGVTVTPTQLGGFSVDSGATAIFAFNDEYALTALDLLLAAGLTPPDPIALVGADDSPAARHAHPRLTTIALGSDRGWERIAQRLHTIVEDEDGDTSPIVEHPTLVPGAST
jgi:DNA-binding LacI/PurR family transcriptional regulator